MQVLMAAAAPVKSLLVWLTEHQSMQSDVPVASSSRLGRLLGQQHVSMNRENGRAWIACKHGVYHSQQ